MERAFSLSVSVPTPFRIPHRVLALIGVITFILACCLAGCTTRWRTPPALRMYRCCTPASPHLFRTATPT